MIENQLSILAQKRRAKNTESIIVIKLLLSNLLFVNCCPETDKPMTCR